MGEGYDGARAVAWAAEMRRVHARLREALALARAAAAAGASPVHESRELLLHCWGFCLALSGHHAAEDDTLFPAVAQLRPDLAEVLGTLRQDHSMLEHLLSAYRAALEARAEPDALLRHLDGIDAIMESHFGFEERRLLGVLESLPLDALPSEALGPLA